MKIFSAEQIQALDAATIEREAITSLELMERAAGVFVEWFLCTFKNSDCPIWIFAGPGNNGGDGLVAARLLQRKFYTVTLVRCVIGNTVSEDFQSNWERLPQDDPIPTLVLRQGDSFPEFPENTIVIDAIFGSGINRPVTGYWASLIENLNAASVERVAIDLPSGLSPDAPTTGACLEAHFTFSFEMPKAAFFYAENQHRVGQWHFKTIGLDREFIEQTPTPLYFTDASTASMLYRPRHRFDHKGTFGHALLVMGSRGKGGAAILATRACVRSGVGLVTIHAPRCLYASMQISNPEAMTNEDEGEDFLTNMPHLQPFGAIAVGCGIGLAAPTAEMLHQILINCSIPLVLDADALNILAANPGWWPLIPPNTILTPHPKEFERLFGPSKNSFERNALLRDRAKTYGVIIALKGAYTCIADPEGNAFFNASGNPGMATGGSGDVLSGLIAGLLAQGYTPLEAAKLGVYLHGLAGDLAAQDIGQEALIAGDLCKYFGKAFQTLYAKKPGEQ